MDKTVFLCSICNISSGSCKEDCGFCTQSIKHKADIERYYKKDKKQVLLEANIAKERGALGFCLVTSGKELDESKLEFVCDLASTIKKEVPSLMLIGCCGISDKEKLKELKKAGIDSYNHNLESSKNHYAKVVHSIKWEERFQTCQSVKEVGLSLCSGGIFGLGESDEDIKSFFDALRELEPMSSPINFFHPNEALEVKGEVISKARAIEIIKFARSKLPQTMLMVAGGRELVFGDDVDGIFKAGANAIVIGDYLTTKGGSVEKTIASIKELGYTIGSSCH